MALFILMIGAALRFDNFYVLEQYLPRLLIVVSLFVFAGLTEILRRSTKLNVAETQQSRSESSGSTDSARKEKLSIQSEHDGRIEFIGRVASERIRREYVGKALTRRRSKPNSLFQLLTTATGLHRVVSWLKTCLSASTSHGAIETPQVLQS